MPPEPQLILREFGAEDEMTDSASRVALSMIVRNEASTLRRCLNSVRTAVDELVIADTGSTDETKAIAAEYGARVIEIPWDKDFASARNRALAEVQSDWVLSLDADEMLEPGAASTVKTLVASQEISGYQVPIRNYVLSLEDRIWDRPAKPNDGRLPEAAGYPAYVDHENVRLFRRDPGIFFIGRVHESVGPRIEQLGLRLGTASFLIHHFGLAADAEKRADKNRFYRELGQLKVTEMPENAQAHLELGLVELDNFGNVDEALAYFQRACTLNPKLGVAWFFAGIAHFRLGQLRDSLRCLKQAEKQRHATQAVAEASGDAHYNLGEFHLAATEYQRALSLGPESSSLESKLGLALVRKGSAEKGLEKIRRTILEKPKLPEMHDRLILSLAWLERVPEAAMAAEEKLRAIPSPTSTDFVRAASLWTKQGNWTRATAILHVGTQIHQNDPLINQALTELISRQGAGVDQLVTNLKKHTADTVDR